MGLSLAEQVAWWALYGAEWVLLLHLWRAGLAERYRSFVIYLALLIASDSILLALEPGTNTYGYVYVAWVIPLSVASLLAVVEIYSLALQPYKALYSASKWAIIGSLGLSFLISLLTLQVSVERAADPYPILSLFNEFQRAFNFALLLFLLLINVYLWLVPVQTSRNTVTHTWVFFLHFGVRTIVHLIRYLWGPATVPWVSLLLLVADLACMVWWRLRLSPEGEVLPRTPGYPWKQETAEELLRQLKELNSQLSRGWWKRS